MSTSGLAPAGSSSYDSNTLHVGDGTWDSSKDTFLLPNLMGLNFATMRYNGMGNRFSGEAEYHSLIRAHGVIAAITFLFIVPLAIFLVRFHWRDPQYAVRVHIWLQILTVLLSTVILVLGWFSVGPERSLTNPHHGIGVAIYVLLMFQTLWGWLVRRWERGRTIWTVSRKLMIHQWVGRATALLGIVQVPLGLTLYGSPKYLFILYTLWMVLLLILWFHYTHRYQEGRGGGGGDDFSSYYGGRTDITGRSRRHVSGGGLLPAVAAGGLAAWAASAWSRRKQERRQSIDERHSQTDVSAVGGGVGGVAGGGRHSHHDSFHSDYTDEKVEQKNDHKWRNRILEGAALAGVAGLAARFIGRRRERQEEQVSEVSGHTGRYTASRTDVSRMEEGNAPGTPANGRFRRSDRVDEEMSSIPPVGAVTPTRPARNRLRRAGGSLISEETQSFYSPGREKRHTGRKVAEGVAAVGVGAWLWNKIRGRERREEDRVEEIHEQDRLAERRQRRNSLGSQRRYTGDNRIRRHDSFSESDYRHGTGPTDQNIRPAAVAAAGATAGAVTSEAMRTSHQELPSASRPTITAVTESSHNRFGSQHDLAPPPPIGGMRRDSSGSDSPGGGKRHRNHGEAIAAGAVAGLAGLAAGGALAEHRYHEQQQQQEQQRLQSGPGEVPSPDVSLRMKTTYDDGRQRVTLQRLTPAQVAAQREAARRATSHSRSRSRRESVSSMTGGNEEHWRRTGGPPPPGPPLPGEITPGGPPYTPRPPPPGGPSTMSPGGYYEDVSPSFAGPSASYAPGGGPPPPPPHHSSSPTTQGLMSPPPVPGSAYGSAAGSRADSNRQRRRAERVRTQGPKGSRVEFS